jgi:cytochrome c peroxidase
LAWFAAALLSAGAAAPAVRTVAAIQFAAASGPGENLTKARELIARVAAAGAQVVVLPEHAFTGRLDAIAETERMLASVASARRIWIIASAPGRSADGKGFAIESKVFSPAGAIVWRQAKLTPRKAWGDGAAAPGDYRALGSIELPGGRSGVSSGDDLARTAPRLAHCGAGTIFVSASWEASDVTRWRADAVRIAAANRINLVIANLAPEGEGRDLRSVVIGRDGAVLAEASSSAEEIVSAALPTTPSESPALGLPSIPWPVGASPSAADIELGRRLFFDAALSGDGRTSCASCHDPERAFADGKRLAEGVLRRAGHRNTPSLLNSGFKTYFGWDGAAETMELQTRHALLGWAEMNMRLSAVDGYLQSAPQYAGLAREGGAAERALGAIAAFVRSLASGDSPFDRYRFGGEASAIGASARRGLGLFTGKARCASCHRMERDHALFSDNGFHNTGVGFHKRFEYLGYAGDGLEGNQATRNRFRGEYVTPSLRNVELTAPYMHDGSLPALADVVAFYNRGGNPNPFLDPLIRPLHLSAAESADLVEFLRTLTSPPARRGGKPMISQNRSK